MGLLLNGTLLDSLLDIIIYAILFNVIYSMSYKVNKKWINVAIYVAVMEIKWYVANSDRNFITCYDVLVSLLVYTILGIIFVKILEKLADYYPRLPYVIAGIGIAILAELFVERILFTIISASLAIVYFQFKIILGYIQIWFLTLFNIN